MSDKAKWSKAPWYWSQATGTICHGDRVPVCRLESRGFSVHNAKLLAAAPELADALANLVRCVDADWQLAPSAINAARAALRKAGAGE